MPDSVRRALRGLFQITVAAIIINVYDAFAPTPFTPQQRDALLALLTVLITFGQNLLEDGGFIPAVGKAPASPGADPVPDPGPGRRMEHHPER